MRPATCLLVLTLTLAGSALAQMAEKPPPSPPPQPRPAAVSPAPQPPHISSQVYLGEPAPDFELDGSQGRPVRLATLKGYWLLLVFADGRASLASLKEIEPDLQRLGVRPYGVCSDKAHVLRAYVGRQGMRSVLLSDITGEISQLYGLYDFGQRAIRPGFVLLDRQGIVHTVLMGSILPMKDVLRLVKESVTSG